MLRFCLIAAFLNVCLAVNSAQAQPYAEAYQRYQQALNTGDTDVAIAAAKEAFEAAEATGNTDSETLAILAQNWFFSALWEKPESVVAVGETVLTLANQGYGLSTYSVEEITAALAYARAAEEPRRQATELADALREFRASSEISNFSVRLHSSSFQLMLGNGQHDEAYDIATGMTRMIETVPGVDPNLVGSSYLLRIAAMLQQDRRQLLGATSQPFRTTLKNARVLIDHVMSLFPPQAGLDDFSVPAAQARAWHSLLRSMEASYDVEVEPDWTFAGKVALESSERSVPGESYGEFFAGKSGTSACNVEWKRRSLVYPAEAQRSGNLGGIYLGFDLLPNGRVARAKVLGEVPADRFGPAFLKQIESWRADPKSIAEPACLKNRTTVVVIVIE